MQSLRVLLGIILLTSCQGNYAPTAFGSTSMDKSQRAPAFEKAHYATIYAFKGGRDGAYPFGGLTAVSGALYGVTENGGSGYGTVYKITPSGNEVVLYGFGGGADGRYPSGDLLEVNGELYGTTESGGTSSQCGTYYPYGCGAVFTVDPTSGKEAVIYNFQGGKDGAEPSGYLADIKGVIYGTTFAGGDHAQCSLDYTIGCGVVFSVTTGGAEKVLHRFKGLPDGINPEGVIAVDGALYGATYGGGKSGCDYYFPQEGCGTLYKITVAGKEEILYRFKGTRRGDEPAAALLANANGTLYGTTTAGGDACKYSSACGAVFSFERSQRAFHLLHAFADNPDGATPQAPMVVENRLLYGTTTGGGGKKTCNGQSHPGCGTIFQVSPSGTEKVLHRFMGGSDGAFPEAGLTLVNGILYGTTAWGGHANVGTVYAIEP